MTEANVQSKPISEIRNKKSKNIVLEVQDEKQFHTIRILLVFARDGATHAEQIVTGMLNFSHEVFIHLKRVEYSHSYFEGFSIHSCWFFPSEWSWALECTVSQSRSLFDEMDRWDGLCDAHLNSWILPGSSQPQYSTWSPRTNFCHEKEVWLFLK